MHAWFSKNLCLKATQPLLKSHNHSSNSVTSLLKPSPEVLQPPLAPLNDETKILTATDIFFETKFSETETLKKLAKV